MGDEREIDFALERRRARGLPPIAGRSDPPTSARAAAQVSRPGKISESEQLIAREIVNWPEGLTACELARKMDGRFCRGKVRDFGWWRLECSRRLGRMAERPALGERGDWLNWSLLRGKKPRICREAGTWQTVWIPARR